MTEAMGPCECDCPQRIMRLLSPVTDIPNPSYTAEWRARVAARRIERRQQWDRRRSLRVGSVVTAGRMPSSFTGGLTASTFQLAHFRRRTPIFEALDRPGFYCRLRGATLAAAVVTSLADPAPPPD